MSFDYSEFSKYIKKLDKSEKDFHTWLVDFILKQAQRVRSGAVRRQRTFAYTNAQGESKIGLIDTGNMIGSWYIKNISLSGSTLEVEIGNSMEYASFIEFGQRSFKGAFLLTLTIDEVQRALPSRFNKEFREFIRSKGL